MKANQLENPFKVIFTHFIYHLRVFNEFKVFYEFYKETTHSEMIIFGVIQPRDQTKTGLLLSILST